MTESQQRDTLRNRQAPSVRPGRRSADERRGGTAGGRSEAHAPEPDGDVPWRREAELYAVLGED
ncbi:hypothetical protein [Kitasatospora sp. NPDC093679]|uniref:hypothetical protein n=1 Tax=Kitasatospora sp. NPDC093679 TaxID=3154983 RepID=UPI00342C6133